MNNDSSHEREMEILTMIRCEVLALARIDRANRAFWYYGQHGPAYSPAMIEWAHDARRALAVQGSV